MESKSSCVIGVAVTVLLAINAAFFYNIIDSISRAQESIQYVYESLQKVDRQQDIQPAD